MSAHPPPVPPANRSPKGESAATPKGADQKVHPAKAPNNLGEQDRQGNTKQNTTNQGYQQDR